MFPRLALTTPSAQPGFPAAFTLSLSNAGTSVGALSANLVYDTSVLSNPVIEDVVDVHELVHDEPEQAPLTGEGAR